MGSTPRTWIVPPGMAVESHGIGILGGFEHTGDELQGHDPSAPVLRVSGVALMGGVDIKVRHPGESGSYSVPGGPSCWMKNTGRRNTRETSLAKWFSTVASELKLVSSEGVVGHKYEVSAVS